MNLASWIVLGVVLAAFAGAVVFLVHRRRTRGSSACEGCSLRSLCRESA